MQSHQNEHFSPFEFSSAGIKNGVWIYSGGLNSLASALIRIRFGSWKVRRLYRT